MNKLSLDQKGIGHLGLLLALVVVGAVAVVGLRVMDSNKTASTNSVTRASVQVPAKITTQADLAKASAALEATNIDNGVNPDQLDKDLNSLL